MTTETAMAQDPTAESSKRVNELYDLAIALGLARAHFLHVTAFGALNENQEHQFAKALRQLDEAEVIAWKVLEQEPNAPKRSR
jgi:hypothetical protein